VRQLVMILVALDEIRRHRLRTTLATLSISAGVAAVTIIVALGGIAEATATTIIERQVGRAATMSITTETSPEEFANDVAPRIAQRLERYGVTDWSREFAWPVQVVSGDLTRPETIYGVDPALMRVRPLQVMAGRWLLPSDSALYAPAVVVNLVWAREFALDAPVGRRIELVSDAERIVGRIVGVVDDAAHESRLYAAIVTTEARFGLAGLAQASAVVHVTAMQAPALASRLVADLAAASLPRLNVQRVDATDDFRQLFQGLELVLGLIAGVSLLTGGLGVLNLGLVTARQRAREFAIRRSFGASGGDVFTIVLAEIVATSLLGGIVGVGVGALVVTFSAPLFADSVGLNDLPPFPLDAALAGLAIASLVGVLAGLAPARRATRDSIIETIRS